MDESDVKNQEEIVKEDIETEKALEEQVEKSSKALWYSFAIIAVLLLLFILWGRMQSPEPPETLEYNNFEFTKIGNFWYFQWVRDGQEYNIPLRFNPREVEDVPLSGSLDERFRSSTPYITFDPENENLSYVALSAGEFSLSLAKALGLQPIAACTKNVTQACDQRQIITCENTNKSVIFIDPAPKTQVVLDGNCLRVRGQGMELLRATDRVLYDWYKII